MMMKRIVIAVAAATLAGCSSSEPDEEENRLIGNSIKQLGNAHANTCRCVSVYEQDALSGLNSILEKRKSKYRIVMWDFQALCDREGNPKK
jgi:hypothetical protein